MRQDYRHFYVIFLAIVQAGYKIWSNWLQYEPRTEQRDSAKACLEVVLIFRDTLQTLPKVWMSLARPLGIRSEECKRVAQR